MGSRLEKAKRYLVAGSFFLHVGKYLTSLRKRNRKRIDAGIGFVLRKMIYSSGKVVPNKIFVMTYDNTYSCNPRYIIEEVLRRELPVEIVWVVSPKKSLKDFPPEIKTVSRGSYTMFDEMASSKVWIDNALSCVWYGMPKKKGQVYINTWHGSLGIKRLSGNKFWLRRASKCNKLTDYCIANSTFEEDVYRETFWKDVPYLQYGHARNDVFFDKEQSDMLREKVYEHFGLENRPKLFLYAPTFRDDGDLSWFTIDFEALGMNLEARFGGEWVILVRMHHKDRKRRKIFSGEEWLLNASNYGDMQELLPAMDAGMTDYSSWAYDFILTKRPLFLYAPDAEKYNDGRGFYYPLETTPFPLVADNEELEQAILSFDEKKYLEDVDEFLKGKGCYDDGLAAKRTADLIEKIISGENTDLEELQSFRKNSDD